MIEPKSKWVNRKYTDREDGDFGAVVAEGCFAAAPIFSGRKYIEEWRSCGFPLRLELTDDAVIHTKHPL